MNFQTATWDFAINTHHVAGIAKQIFENSIRGLNFFSHHIQFMLFPIAALYNLVKTPLLLIFFQSVLTALSGIFVFKLALLKLKDEFAAFLIGIIYYSVPVIGFSLLYEFHPPVLALFFLTGYLYFDYSKNKKLAFLLLIMAILCEENIALLAAGAGFYKLLNRNYKEGLSIFLISITYFVLIIFVVKKIPGELKYDPHLFYFSHFGQNYSDILKTIIFCPLKVIKNIFSPVSYKLEYLFYLFVPFILIPLLDIKLLIVIFPVLFINMASNFSATSNITTYFSVNLIPFFMLSLINFVSKFKKKSVTVITGFILLWILIFHFLGAGLTGPSILSFNFNVEKYKPYFAKKLYEKCMNDFFKPGLKIASDENLSPHLDSPGDITVFPYGLDKINTDYAVINYERSVFKTVNSNGDIVTLNKPYDYEKIEKELIKKYGYVLVLKCDTDNPLKKVHVLRNMRR